MIFETEQDLIREKKAITLFVNTFGGSYKKLDPFDIDYKVFDKDGNLISYVEVKGRIKTMRDAYPLPISAKKLMKLVDKRLAPVIIWSCEDGIIYAEANKLHGEIKMGGRKPRDNSYSDIELMIYYDKQKDLKYVRFT
jgi:hypothetical protein|tara:strand:- start:1724 stop:2137 length:414 start_codon:yes stop_codon:yes gene_type:complete